MKKALGYLLLSLPFIAIFINGWIAMGFWWILSCFLASIAILGIVVLGVNLIMEVEE